MSERIFRYWVKVSSDVPSIWSGNNILRRFRNKRDALVWVLENGKGYGPDSEKLYIEEREYTSEANLERDFPLYCRPIWAAYFHGYEMLERMIESND